MPINAVISIGCFAISNALLHHQNRQLRQKNRALAQVVDADHDVIRLLAQKIDDAGIQLDEFDNIALATIAEKLDL